MSLYPPLFVVAQTAEVSGRLLEYGILGICAIVLGVAVKVLYNRVDDDRAYHRARADRLEEELAALNALVRGEYLGTLAKATEAISDFVQVSRGR